MNALLSLCFLWLSIGTTQAAGPKETRDKVVKATYQVKSNDLLELDNKYGNVWITNHAGNSVEIEVKITAWDGTGKKAQETLDRINIQREQKGRKISLKTVIYHDDYKKVVLNSSRGFSIHYIIKMPEQMGLELDNKFGNVELENVLGEVELEVKHGHLKTGMLGKGEVEVKFGNVDIEGFQETASVEVKHGNLQIEQAKRLEVDQSHGHFKLGSVEHLEGEVEHGNTSVKEVAKALDWENEFGNFALGKVGSNFNKVKLEVKHGNATLGFDAASKFALVAKAQHGKVNHSIKNIQQDKGHFEQAARGAVNGGGNASVDIAVDFGNINLR